MRKIKDTPRNVDVRIVEGMFLIQYLVYLPLSFGGVENVIMSCLGIKRWWFHRVRAKVSGPKQRRSKDLKQALKSESVTITGRIVVLK